MFNLDAWLAPLLIAVSLSAGVAMFLVDERRTGVRPLLNLLGATLTLILVVVMLGGVHRGHTYESTLSLAGVLTLSLRADPLPMLFVTLSSVLWLVTTIYAIGYLRGTSKQRRFFGYFSLCVASTVGIALAGDLLTFLLFYELLTRATHTLVEHRGTKEAHRAGTTYAAYTSLGSVLLLAGIIWLYVLTGDLCFIEAGRLSGLTEAAHGQLRAIFVLLVLGFGVKAALIPLHGWLPRAMVAPAPVSALLHAVAVVKAGAFGIVRVVADVFGIEFARDLGVMFPLTILASATIVYGSLRALAQDDLKRRLAYSTVSQVSYIALGMSIGTPLAATGGIVHLVHQGLMKITLFFCAGSLAQQYGITKVSHMNGAGRLMPWTMGAFSVAALGMIGMPPVAGFVSKWYLALGAAESGQLWVLVVLAASSLLNAAYFLPIVFRAWCAPPTESPVRVGGHDPLATQLMLWPSLVTASLALAAGLMAAAPFSPLAWAEVIVQREFGL